VRIVGESLHTGSSLTVKFIDNLKNIGEKSYGIRDLTLTLGTKSAEDVNTFCGYSDEDMGLVPKCACEFGEYFTEGSCMPCAPTCDSCFGPSPSQCYNCKTPGGTLNGGQCILCNSTCKNCFVDPNFCTECISDYYLLSDQTCAPSCHPYISTTPAVVNPKCTSTCLNMQYLYWNKSCLASCEAPLRIIKSGYDSVCEYPCQDNEFLYADGNCSNSCPDPLSARTESGKNFCDSICPGGEYIFQNGTCNASCSPPYKPRAMNSLLFCDPPCSDSQYLAPDGTCLDSCDFPMIKQKVDNLYYCQSPCQEFNSYMLPNGVCISDCEFPLVEKSGPYKACVSVCGPNRFLDEATHECISKCDSSIGYWFSGNVKVCEKVSSQVNALTQAGKITSPVLRTAATATIASSTLSASGSIGAFSLITLNKFLLYTRYIDINYPEIMQQYYQLNTKTDNLRLNFLFPFKNFVFTPLNFPRTIAKYEEFTGFLSDYWENLLTMALILLIIAFLKLLELLCKANKWTAAASGITQITVIFQWNFLLIILCTSVDEIVLFTVLEIMNLRLVSIFGVISFFTAILFVIFVCKVIGINISIVRKIRAADSQICPDSSGNPKEDVKKQFMKFQVLFRAFKDTSFIQQGYFLVSLLRCIAFHLVIATLYNFPLVQIILLNIMSVTMLVILIWKKPFTKRVHLLEQLIEESIIFLVNILVLVLALADVSSNFDENAKELIGSIVIILFVCFALIGAFFLIASVVGEVKGMCKKQKKELKRSKTIANWVRMMTIPFQSGGLEFASSDNKSVVEKDLESESSNIPLDISRNKSRFNHKVHPTKPIKLSFDASSIKGVQPIRGLDDKEDPTTQVMTTDFTTERNQIFGEKTDESMMLKKMRDVTGQTNVLNLDEGGDAEISFGEGSGPMLNQSPPEKETPMEHDKKL